MNKSDFSIFEAQPDLVYLDSAATALKPAIVIEAVSRGLREAGSVGRGLYPLSVDATNLYEKSRQTIAEFFHVSPSEIVMTSGATASFNLLAHALERSLQKDDEIIISTLEHHSNLLPWQQLAERKELTLKVLPLTETGEIDLEKLPSLLNEKTKIVSLAHTSNVLGTMVNPQTVRKILDQQGSGATFILDGCQSAPHIPLSLSSLGCDFFVASSHKLYGPSGVGILWGRSELLATLTNPFPGGGAVEGLQHGRAIWQKTPHNLEAGSLNLEGAIGLATALTYLHDMHAVADHTNVMTQLLRTSLSTVENLRILGNPHEHGGIVSFTFNSIHPHDIADFLGSQQICIRAGHHCARPLHEALTITASCRTSVGVYTTEEDIHNLVKGLQQVSQVFHA